jgi:hypothetical protein
MIVRGTPMDLKIRLQIKRIVAIAAIVVIASTCTLDAGSATWNLNPVNNQWNDAQNWTPTTVPYGENDVATFGTSNVTDVTLGVTPNGDAGNILGGIVFGPGARAYTITMTAVLGQPSYLLFLRRRNHKQLRYKAKPYRCQIANFGFSPNLF